jgi:hypothetical protein
MQRLVPVSAVTFHNVEILVEMFVVVYINVRGENSDFSMQSILKLDNATGRLCMRFEGTTAHPEHGKEGS